MMSNSDLYGIWQKRVKQLLPKDLKYVSYRLTNLVWLAIGMYKAKSVHLNLIACHVPIRIRKLSLVRRFRRFIANDAFCARTWYEPVVRELIAAASSAGQVHLLIDSTKVSAGNQLVMVAIAYRRRSLPLAWTWINHPRGHSTGAKQIALLSYLQTLIPAGVTVSLVGDSEFGGKRLMRKLDEWGWEYVLRQRGKLRFMLFRSTFSYRFDQLKLAPGDRYWMGRVDLTSSQAYLTNVVIYWAHTESAPWFLATNLPGPHGAIMFYRRRMWIEEMFGDMKSHGFNLERTRFHHPERLSRITFVVCLLFLWLVALGDYVTNNNLTHEIDRTDRQDLCVFRLGWDFLQRRLLFYDPIPIVFIPSFKGVR
jgi:hypothetical protein